MLYTILISIVFISEVIIFLALMSLLWTIDRRLVNSNAALTSEKTKIRDICELCKNISWQIKELSGDFVEKYKKMKDDFETDLFSKILLGLFLWKINKKFILKYRRSKLLKLLVKGLKLIENVV